MKRIIAILCVTSTVYAGEPETILVRGKCETKVVPDRGTVTFTAENQSTDQQEAVAKTNEQIELLKKEISNLKLNHLELKNTAYTLSPIKEWEKDRLVDKGMRASLALQVDSSDITRLGEVMAQASKIGITNVGSLNTYLSIQKSQAEYLKCLEVAAQDAKAKAQKLAKNLGFDLGDVSQVIEAPQLQQHQEPVPVRAMMKAEMDTASSGPVIEAGEQNFSASVQIKFHIDN